MTQFRMRPLVTAAVVASAAACVLLSACSGGSISPSAGGPAASAAGGGAATAGSQAGSSGPAGSSGGSASGSSGSATSSPASSPAGGFGGVDTSGLTGNFCTDFSHMSESLSALPTPRANGNLADEEATARKDLAIAGAKFNGLATEAPPNVAAAIHNVTALYQTFENDMSGVGSLSDLRAHEKSFLSDGKYLSSVRVLVSYTSSKCD